MAGDRPLIDEYSVVQFAPTLLEPFVGAYIKLTGGTDFRVDAPAGSFLLGSRINLNQFETPPDESQRPNRSKGLVRWKTNTSGRLAKPQNSVFQR